MRCLISFGAVGTAGHRHNFVPAFFLVLSSLTLTGAVSAAELVVNGGFEEPVVEIGLTGFGWETFYGVNQALSEPDDCPADDKPHRCNDDIRVPGWSVYWTDDIINHEQLNAGRLEIHTGGLDIIDPPIPPAYDGSLQKAELDSHHRIGNDNNNVTITQVLPTCPMSAYQLNYAWKSRTEEPGDNDVRVVIDDKLVKMHAQNLEWEEEAVHFLSDDSGETLLLFGSIGTQSTHGMFLDEVSVTGPDGSDPGNCSLICGDKPIELTLRYDGDDDSDHGQSGNEVIISPEVVASYPADATIKVYGHNKKNAQLLGTFEVPIGEIFSVSGPRKRIPPRLTFAIYNDAGALIQTVAFHTSCSQPLGAGDEFGAITVWSAVN